MGGGGLKDGGRGEELMDMYVILKKKSPLSFFSFLYHK